MLDRCGNTAILQPAADFRRDAPGKQRVLRHILKIPSAKRQTVYVYARFQKRVDIVCPSLHTLIHIKPSGKLPIPRATNQRAVRYAGRPVAVIKRSPDGPSVTHASGIPNRCSNSVSPPIAPPVPTLSFELFIPSPCDIHAMSKSPGCAAKSSRLARP